MVKFKFGKKPVRFDPRVVRMKDALSSVTALPALPTGLWMVDKNALNTTITPGLFGNDTYGDCVEVTKGNLTLLAQYLQQGKQIDITTQDILDAYWAEEAAEGDGNACCLMNALSGKGWNNHPDDGLVMLDSMNYWVTNGLKCSDGHTYQLYGFASLNPQNIQELQYSIYLLYGAAIGLQLPQSAMDQFNAGEIWDVVSGSPIIGGHGVAGCGFDSVGPYCYTWGGTQHMTWDFFTTYVDEAYAPVMSKDAWLATDPANPALFEQYAQLIAALTQSPVPSA